MTGTQLRVLSKIKKLVSNGQRKFEIRKDRDYVEDLLDIGITEEEAWSHIFSLNKNFWFVDPKPNYYKDENALIFKKEVNGVLAYIKLKIEVEENFEKAVCLSFHRDKKRR